MLTGDRPVLTADRPVPYDYVFVVCFFVLEDSGGALLRNG